MPISKREGRRADGAAMRNSLKEVAIQRDKRREEEEEEEEEERPPAPHSGSTSLQADDDSDRVRRVERVKSEVGRQREREGDLRPRPSASVHR